MPSGFIKIDRGISDWPEFYKAKQKGLTLIEAYLWLMDNARYSDKHTMREWNGECFYVQKNQVVASLAFLAKAWGLVLSSGAFDKKKVQRYLQKLHKYRRIHWENTANAQCITVIPSIQPTQQYHNNTSKSSTFTQKHENQELKKDVGEQKDKATLMRNSDYANFKHFLIALKEDDIFTLFDANLNYYHNVILDWSNSRNQLSYDWIAEARNWMRRDKMQGKLITNQQAEKIISNGSAKSNAQQNTNNKYQKGVDKLADMLWDN